MISKPPKCAKCGKDKTRPGDGYYWRCTRCKIARDGITRRKRREISRRGESVKLMRKRAEEMVAAQAELEAGVRARKAEIREEKANQVPFHEPSWKDELRKDKARRAVPVAARIFQRYFGVRP